VPSATPTRAVAASGTRDVYLDALKAFAIVLVIATHILGLRPEFRAVSPWLYDRILSFNMPLFTILSGWVLAGREGSHPGKFLWKKFLALYVPYFAWIAVEAPFRKVTLAGLPARLFGALIDPHAGMQMWFLAVLFWMFVVFVLARLVSRSQIWTGLVAVAVGGIALLLPRVTTMGLDKLAWLYPFFILGYLLAAQKGDRRGLAWVGAGTVAAIALYAVMGGLALANAYLIALAISAVVAALFRLLPRRVLEAMAWLGRRTLGVYGAQMVVMPFCIVGVAWWGALASWALTVAVATLLAFALEHTTFTRAAFLGQWPKGTRTKHPTEFTPDPA
jgi:fucose 4-O-acetylase-like acetyltransferase